MCDQRFTGIEVSVVMSTSDHLPSLNYPKGPQHRCKVSFDND